MRSGITIACGVLIVLAIWLVASRPHEARPRDPAHHAVVADDRGGTAATLPQTREVRTLGDVGLDEVRDDPVGADTKDAPTLCRRHVLPLFRLVKWAETCDPARLERPVLNDVAALLASPDRERGHAFQGTGRLVHLLSVGPGEGEANDAGVDAYVTGWIVTDRSQLLQFVAPAAQGEERKPGENVYFTGFFFGVTQYDARNGSRRVAPVFVLPTLLHTRAPRERARDACKTLHASILAWKLLLPDQPFPASDERDPWGRPYAVERTAKGIRVSSRGPDGVAGTADDVVYPSEGE